MKISELKRYFTLENGIDSECEYKNVFVGDVLSFAISHIKDDSIWITIQNNVNVIAVSKLTDVKAIILTEGMKPDEQMLKKSIEENIPIFSTYLSSYETIKLLITQEENSK